MSETKSNQPLRIFIGYDHRQPVALNVLQFSIFRRSSKPVAITPIVLPTLPMKRTGLTPFTYSRFLVPWLSDYQGWALFLDIDFLVLGDIAELFALADDRYAAMVSKNPKKFEWASMILFNCGHPANRVLTPDYVDDPERCRDIDPDEYFIVNNGTDCIDNSSTWIFDISAGEIRLRT